MTDAVSNPPLPALPASSISGIPAAGGHAGFAARPRPGDPHSAATSTRPSDIPSGNAAANPAPGSAPTSTRSSAPSSAPSAEAPDLAQASILLVDDNQQNLELVQAYLESLPCSIRTARDGLEAIAMIDSDCPDLVLLDVMMPRMSGFEVCQKIKSNPATRDVVVIMLTALHEVGDFERAVECGTNDFITKPVNKLELLTRVRSLLELRLVKKRFDQLLGLRQHARPDNRERPGAGENLE